VGGSFLKSSLGALARARDLGRWTIEVVDLAAGGVGKAMFSPLSRVMIEDNDCFLLWTTDGEGDETSLPFVFFLGLKGAGIFGSGSGSSCSGIEGLYTLDGVGDACACSRAARLRRIISSSTISSSVTAIICARSEVGVSNCTVLPDSLTRLPVREGGAGRRVLVDAPSEVGGLPVNAVYDATCLLIVGTGGIESAAGDGETLSMNWSVADVDVVCMLDIDW